MPDAEADRTIVREKPQIRIGNDPRRGRFEVERRKHGAPEADRHRGELRAVRDACAGRRGRKDKVEKKIACRSGLDLRMFGMPEQKLLQHRLQVAPAADHAVHGFGHRTAVAGAEIVAFTEKDGNRSVGGVPGAIDQPQQLRGMPDERGGVHTVTTGSSIRSFMYPRAIRGVLNAAAHSPWWFRTITPPYPSAFVRTISMPRLAAACASPPFASRMSMTVLAMTTLIIASPHPVVDTPPMALSAYEPQPMRGESPTRPGCLRK